MKFDRNTVIGFVILAALFFGYFYYFLALAELTISISPLADILICNFFIEPSFSLYVMIRYSFVGTTPCS